MQIELLRNIVVKGLGALERGTVVEVTDNLGRQLVQMGRAMEKAGVVLQEIAEETAAEGEGEEAAAEEVAEEKPKRGKK